jgi:hypothetical protein
MYIVSAYIAVFGLARGAVVGVNEAGYTFVVRETGHVVFDREPRTQCSETFVFPNSVPTYGHSAAVASELVPCATPDATQAAELAAFIAENNITSTVYCAHDNLGRVQVSCFSKGVLYASRLGRNTGQGESLLTNRINCAGDDQEAAVLECAVSLKSTQVLRDNMRAALNAAITKAVVQPKTEKAVPVAQKEEEAPPVPPVEETAHVVVVENPVEQTVNQDEELNERNLGVVNGRNQAGYTFTVMDGIVTFQPRVGEECRESYYFDNLSTSQKYNAVTRTAFAPCQPLDRTVRLSDINPQWDIVAASVDCTDPVHITVSCKVSFSPTGAPVEMSRRAILQAIKERKYLSSRVECGAPTEKELLECAAIATNYAAIKSEITN